MTTRERKQGAPLTEREIDVLRAVLAGHTYRKEIAAALVLEVRTVDCHLYSIFGKTGAGNMTDLVLMAWGRKGCPLDLSKFV